MSKVYCKSPWTALFVQLDGQVKTCCSGSHVLGNLNSESIESILVNDKITNIRQTMLAGDIPSYCSYCQNIEAQSGPDSSQRRYFEQFDLSDPVVDQFDLQSVDVRWNTLCNLKCVYCNEGWSTTWQQAKSMPIKPMYYNYYDGFLAYLNQHSQGITNLILAGGEPLLHKQNVQLLEQSRNDAVIDVITNLSVPLESSSVFRTLRNKPQVRWHVSLENTGARFEYVRHGANWNQMLQNIQTLKQLPGHHITLFPLYCIYSATNVEEITRLVNDLDVGVYWQKLSMPDQLDVNNFSTPVRQLAKSQLEPLLDQRHGKEFFQNLYQTLDQEPRRSVDQKFATWTATYETRYSQQAGQFQQLWPELTSVLEK